MLITLVKLACELDIKGEFEMADKIDAAVKSLAERVGLKLEELVSLADHFDNIGETTIASQLDVVIKEAAKKKEEKKEKKRPRPPKGWVAIMEKKIKKTEPSYNKKMIRETLGAEWYDKMTDKAVEKMIAKYK